MFNFVLLIPFILIPQIVYIVMYLLLKAGIICTPIAMASSFLPGPILGFLAGGGIGFGIFILAACLFSCIAYYPFVKIMDNQALKEESAE